MFVVRYPTYNATWWVWREEDIVALAKYEAVLVEGLRSLRLMTPKVTDGHGALAPLWAWARQQAAVRGEGMFVPIYTADDRRLLNAPQKTFRTMWVGKKGICAMRNQYLATTQEFWEVFADPSRFIVNKFYSELSEEEQTKMLRLVDRIRVITKKLFSLPQEEAWTSYSGGWEWWEKSLKEEQFKTAFRPFLTGQTRANLTAQKLVVTLLARERGCGEGLVRRALLQEVVV